MPHERIPRIRYDIIGPPDGCQECPTAKAVVSACAAAVKGLRSSGYNEPPDYAHRRDRSCWVREAVHGRLVAEDPAYVQLVTEYETANRQRSDMIECCSGGTIDRPPDGAAMHVCHYEPSEGLPALPVPPGTVPLPSAD